MLRVIVGCVCVESGCRVCVLRVIVGQCVESDCGTVCLEWL